MSNFNRAILLGRLTKDPESRFTPKGTAISKFSLAISRYYKNESGEKVEQTDFVNCEAYGKSAQNIEKWCHKGKLLMVEGSIRTDSWEKNGVKQYRTFIAVDNFQFMPDGSKGNFQTVTNNPSPNPAKDDFKY